MKRFRFRKAASADMRRVARESRTRWGEAQTAVYIGQLRSDIKTLGEFPERYPEYERRPGLRRMNSVRHAVFYLVLEDRIEIVRVLPAVRDLRQELGI